jgi:hypothetical protein
VNFNELKTLDANNLIDVYNTIKQKQLAGDFCKRYDKLREDRNKIFHSVSNNLEINMDEIPITILEIVHCLIGEHRWLSLRQEFINNSLKSLNRGFFELHDQLMKETDFVVHLLDHSSCLKYLGLNKDITSYVCPTCAMAISPYYLTHPVTYGLENRLSELTENRRIAFAQFIKNESCQDKLWCYCCSKEIEVV